MATPNFRPNDSTAVECHLSNWEISRQYAETLNATLIFAGLFSAVLSAFLIEIRKGLKDDLLLQILHALQGSSSDLPFHPTSVSVWVNGFWFMSLASSMMRALGIMLASSLSGRWVLDVIDIAAVSQLVKSPIWQSEGRDWLAGQPPQHMWMMFFGRSGWLKEQLRVRLKQLERMEHLEHLEQIEWLEWLKERERERFEGNQYPGQWEPPPDLELEQRERQEREKQEWRERERLEWRSHRERGERERARELQRRVGNIDVRGGHLTFYAKYLLLVHLIEIFIYIAFVLFFAGLAVLLYTDQRNLGIGLLVIISVIATVYLVIVLHNLFAIYSN